MRKLLLLLMALVLPMVACASSELISGQCGENATFVLDRYGTLTISGTGAMSGKKPWTSYSTCLTRVIVEEGITTINSTAFYGCSAISYVSLPSTLTAIGSLAFERGLKYGATIVCSAVAPPTVGEECFDEFRFSGVTLYVPETALETYKTTSPWSQFSKILTFQPVLLAGSCGENVSFVLGIDGTLTISGTGAMSDFTENAQPWKDFRSQITNVVVAEGVTSIGEYALYGCHCLSLTIGSTVTSIGSHAFYNCQQLCTITCEATDLTSTGYNIFRNVPQDNIVLYVPASLLETYKAASWCYGFFRIISIEEPDVIAGYCGDPLAYELSTDGTLYIHGATSSYDYTLETQPWADYRDQIKRIEISSHVYSLGANLFNSCTALETVVCHATSVPRTGTGTFENVPLSSATLYVPSSALDNYKADEVWNDFGTIWPIGYKPSTSFQGAKRVFGESLLQSYYDGSKTFMFHYDDNGYVTQVDCEKSGKKTSYTITYGDEILAYSGTSLIGTASLNDRGFISRMNSSEGSVEFKYNEDDQIVEVDYGNGDVVYLTYTNGNVTQVTNNNKVINFYYETETQGKIKNTGQIMEFERIFGLDFDDIEPYYFAGAFGKATTHLPLSSSMGESIVKITWTLDSQGRATKAVNTDGKTLRWDWGEGGDTPSTAFQGAKRVFGDNLLQTRSDGRLYTYTYDDNGFLTNIERKTSEGSVDKVFNVTYGDQITFTYSSSTYVITLNERGFVKSCDYLNDNEHVEFRYNDDDQLIYVDWDGHVTNITYTDGNITRVVDGGNVYDFSYETATQGKIENKAYIMELDGIYQVDLDYFSLLYYGGFLGKATTHLPLSLTTSGMTISCTWTLDSKGYGVHVDGGDKGSLSWSWADGGEPTPGPDPEPSVLLSGECGENLHYELSSDYVLTITGYGDMYDYNGNIPWGDYALEPRRVVLPDGLTKIGNAAFAYCSKLTSITIPNGVKSIGNSSFASTSITSLVLPNSVTSIGAWAFASCAKLESVTLGTNLKTISDDAFFNCTSLKALTIPSSVTEISYWGIISGCSALESIKVEAGNTVYDSRNNCDAIIETASNTLIAGCQNTLIPNDVTSIRYGAFNGQTNLTSIVIPANVKDIESRVFAKCTNLKTVTCMAESLPTMGTSVFDEVPLASATLYVPESALEAYKAADLWKDFGTILPIGDTPTPGPDPEPTALLTGKCGDNVNFVLSSDYVLKLSGTGPMYDYQVSSQPWNLYNAQIVTIEIGEGITGIGENAFYGCKEVSTITVPMSVTTVGSNAFYGCLLRSVVALQTDPQNYHSAFSNLTYIHALLYVPQSTYWDYVYIGEWGTFVHIKEYATTAQTRRAYMLADKTGTIYTVFNDDSGALEDVDVEDGISEDQLANNWVVEAYGTRQSLLNLGADKYARIDENGQMSLSDTPQAMDIVLKNGVADINGRQMMLILNKDELVTKVVNARYAVPTSEVDGDAMYDLSGRRLTKMPSSGVYIKSGHKYIVK